MNESSRPATEWVRKRDGEVVRFDVAQLARSLQLAATNLGTPLPLDALDELARMAAFFLSSNISGQVAGSDDVAEWVEKSLRETGQEELADAYSSYRGRKSWARGALVVRHGADAAPTGTNRPECWDKSQIVQSLRGRLGLDARRARDIASQVERSVLAGRFAGVTTDLIREIVNNELAARQIPDRLTASRHVYIGTDELKAHLAAPGGAMVADRLVAGRVWRDFSLREIVSRDVMDAELRGLLRIEGLDSPASLAATCVDCSELARRSIDARESIAHVGARLARAAEISSRTVAIDGVESLLTAVASVQDTPAELAEMFWLEFGLRLRTRPVECVLNLHGGLPPDSAGVGAGPLFSQQPLSAEREFAGAVCQEILGRFQRDAAECGNLRIDWHWYAGADAVQLALRQRLFRLIGDELPVAVAFDRGVIPLAAGLRRIAGRVRPVLDFVGISLPIVWRDAGSPRSLSAIEDGLAHGVQLAVRGAVQRREFMRRLPGAPDAELVDPSLLAIFPIGLDWTIRQLVGKGFAEDAGALRLAETTVRLLREFSEREARHFSLGVLIDHPTRETSSAPSRVPFGDTSDATHAAANFVGSVPCADAAGVRRQIYSTGQLQDVAQAGTLTCAQPAESLQNVDWLNDLLDWSSRDSRVARLKLVAERAVPSQTLVEWPDA